MRQQLGLAVASLKGQRLRRGIPAARRYQLLARFFDSLRSGQTTARGQLPCGSQLLLMPPERRDGQTTLAKHGKAVAAERTWSLGEFLRGNTAYGCCS
jgi:hypothetical protein